MSTYVMFDEDSSVRLAYCLPPLQQRRERLGPDEAARPVVAGDVDRLVDPQVVRAHHRVGGRRQIELGRVEVCQGAVAGKEGPAALRVEAAGQVEGAHDLPSARGDVGLVPVDHRYDPVSLEEQVILLI